MLRRVLELITFGGTMPFGWRMRSVTWWWWPETLVWVFRFITILGTMMHRWATTRAWRRGPMSRGRMLGFLAVGRAMVLWWTATRRSMMLRWVLRLIIFGRAVVVRRRGRPVTLWRVLGSVLAGGTVVLRRASLSIGGWWPVALWRVFGSITLGRTMILWWLFRVIVTLIIAL